MKIYYYANQIYQLSYALPYYRRFGGCFIISSITKFVQFKKYLRNYNFHDEKVFLRTPEILLRNPKDLLDLTGALISFSNTMLSVNHDKCKLIFHEHGASDKRIGSNVTAKTKEKLQNFDYILLMGSKNRIKLEQLELDFSEGKYFEMGNLRFDDYPNLKRNEEMDRLKISDQNRKNVLYAPTWRFGSGTLKKYFKPFAKQITRNYNLIVRPHFHESKYIPALCFWAKMHKIRNIYFSDAKDIIHADTYSLFKLSDILLSDTSAVLYEYLITGNPIIVVDDNYQKRVKIELKYDIMQKAEIFTEKMDICELIHNCLSYDDHRKEYNVLLENSFYYTKSLVAKRAELFLKKLEKEMPFLCR
ncbi:MAG: CDP-glycerol glycerophosphotransferase family protein [FCB group bacterium]|nr:CDP-glycerol glycerophosphotransferase family protein [FCB group bacterium]